MRKRKKGNHEETHMDEKWLVPYSDVLTLLLALFIVLFSASSIDSDKARQLSNSLRLAFQGGTGVLQFENPIQDYLPIEDSNYGQYEGEQMTEEARKFQEETQKLNELATQLNQYLLENNLTGALTTEVSEQGLKITIEESALFDSGRADIKPEARDLALRIADLLVEVPNREITITGHTDNVPMKSWRFKSNWELGAARAINFLDVILENPKLSPDSFKIMTHAEYRPIADNNTAEGRAKNRRVEVMIERMYSNPDDQ